MNRVLVHAVVWFALWLVAVADLAAYYPRLPEQVASHFNAAGEPDGWSERSVFLSSWIITLGLMGLFGPAMTWLIHVIPARFLNLPHREFWLAPERIDWTRRTIGNLVASLCGLLFVTLVALNHLTMRANLCPQPNLGSWPWMLLAANLVLTLGLILGSVQRFRRR